MKPSPAAAPEVMECFAPVEDDAIVLCLLPEGHAGPHAAPSVVDITGVDAIRRAVVAEMENEGVVTWGDPRHRERFLAPSDAALPPSAPEDIGLRTALEHVLAEIAEPPIGQFRTYPEGYAQGWNDFQVHVAAVLAAALASSPAAPTEGRLRALRAEVEAERERLPKARLDAGEVLHVREDTGALLTEVQRGSLQGQGAALSWVLHRIDAALASSPKETP